MKISLLAVNELPDYILCHRSREINVKRHTKYNDVERCVGKQFSVDTGAAIYIYTYTLSGS